MIAIALAADWLGIVGQPGFGQKQLAIAIAGGLTTLMALGLRTGKLLVWAHIANSLSDKTKERVALLSLLILAVCMNGFLMVRNPNMYPDTFLYHGSIHNLIEGKGYGFGSYLLRPIEPGYGFIYYIIRCPVP